MRKWNAVLSMGILVLFLIHAILGGFQLAGIMPGGSAVLQMIAWVMMAAIMLHMVIGIRLTVQTWRAGRQAKARYWKENKLFWIRRISGFAVMLLILFHVLIFLGKNESGYRLKLFEGAQLTTQLLLVAAVAVHVISNIRPLMIGLGIKSTREYLTDILLILSVLLLFMAAAFILYYLRWNVF